MLLFKEFRAAEKILQYKLVNYCKIPSQSLSSSHPIPFCFFLASFTLVFLIFISYFWQELVL